MSKTMEENKHRYNPHLTFVNGIIINIVKQLCGTKNNLKYCIGKINNPYKYIMW